MSTKEIIGRGTWIDKVAHELIEREKKLGRSLDLIRTESGLGASGIPHVGSMADAVRAYAVSLALKDMGYNSETIAFSDDLDGLRKIPEGLPKELENYLLWPVSLIPDPYGCHESYGKHMSSLLLEALDKAGIEYTHKSAYEVYKSGKMVNEIHEILLNWRRVGQIIYEETEQDKFLRTLPYFAICKRCGRIYTTEAYEYDPNGKKVKYRCVGAEIRGKWHEGCGYEGWAYIYKADGKLSWKSEFAARWRMLDIRFEAYGKDIADSVRVNDRISKEILKFEPPYHVRYEMFLDTSGRKVSKSRGNVFTPQLWYRYGAPESLILFLLKRFTGTRKVSFNTVVQMMRELDMHKDVYFGRLKIENPLKRERMKGLLEYSYRLGEIPDIKVPYDLVLSLAEVAPEGKETEFITTRLKKYGYNVDSKEISDIITYAINWVKDFGPTPEREREIELDNTTITALKDLIKEIRGLSDGEEIQGKIFTVARRHRISPRKFFKTLYQIIIGRDRGPRMGPLIADIGVERVIQQIEKIIANKEQPK